MGAHRTVREWLQPLPAPPAPHNYAPPQRRCWGQDLAVGGLGTLRWGTPGGGVGSCYSHGSLMGLGGSSCPFPSSKLVGVGGQWFGTVPPLLCLDLFIYFVVLGWEEAAGVGGSWSVPGLGSVQPPGTAVMSPVGVSLSLPKLTPPPWLWGAAQGGCWDSFNRLVGSPRFNCKKKRRKKEKEKKNWKRIKKTSLDPKCVGGGLGGGAGGRAQRGGGGLRAGPDPGT